METSCGLRAMGRTTDEQVLMVFATRTSIIHGDRRKKKPISSIDARGKNNETATRQVLLFL